MVKIKDLITFEETLLRIKKRYTDGELKLSLRTLVYLNQELRSLSDYTNAYLELSGEVENEDMLNEEFDYDITKYEKIITSEEIKSFFGIKYAQ